MIEKLANVDPTHELHPPRKTTTESPSHVDNGPVASEPLPKSPPPEVLEQLDRGALALQELAGRGLRVTLDIDMTGESILFEVVDDNGTVGQISSVRLLDLLNGGGAEGLLFDALG